MLLRRSRTIVALLFGIVIIPVGAAAQNKAIKPLPANASLAETQTWLVNAITKYGTYKTRVNSASVSDVKFDGCSVGLTILRRTAVAAQDVMGVTTRRHSAKQDVAFHMTFVEPDGISVTDHIFPEFQIITLRFRSGDSTSTSGNDGREQEIIVKSEAGQAIVSALKHARQLCTAKN